MASETGEQSKCSEENTLHVGRIVYDVIVYTLTKCGLPETSLPSTGCEEIVHKRANFLEIAGASVLRISLIMRDKWRRMFLSRNNSHGFSDEDVVQFLSQMALCCPLSRRRMTQSMVELFLALCNESMLFFHHENINIDFSELLVSVSVHIVGFCSFDRDSFETIEDLFDEFDNISEYTRWITDFIRDYALPYGSRDDVSSNFFKYVKNWFSDELKKLEDSLGFLPHDLYADITIQKFLPVAENLSHVSSPILHGECKSALPLVMPANTGSDVPEDTVGHPPQDSLSMNVSEQPSQDGQSSSKMELDDGMRQMSLGAQATSPTSLGKVPKRKKSKKKNQRKS